MNISEDVVEIIWDSIDEKSWENLWYALEYQEGDIRWLKENTLSLLKQEVADLRRSSLPFPRTQQELGYILNSNLGRYIHS
jgi:hypothetical protein